MYLEGGTTRVLLGGYYPPRDDPSTNGILIRFLRLLPPRGPNALRRELMRPDGFNEARRVIPGLVISRLLAKTDARLRDPSNRNPECRPFS